MKYVLAIPEFDADTAKRIGRFRSKHEPDRAELVPPHITLMFGIRDETDPALLEVCESVADRMSAFEVTLGQAEVLQDPFEQTNKLVLLLSGGAQTLNDIHSALYDGLGWKHWNADAQFRPHMTIASNPDSSFLSGLDVMVLGTFPIVGLIKSLCVVSLEGDRLHWLRAVYLRSR